MSDFRVFTIDPESTVRLKFDRSDFYETPRILSSCLNSLELDRTDFYYVAAGSLDLPKLTLKKIRYDSIQREVELKLGSSSYYDIFYTHNSPDLVLSTQQATERFQKLTLRSLFGHGLSEYYDKEKSKKDGVLDLTLSPLLPNPIGVSGIVIGTFNGKFWALLRRR